MTPPSPASPEVIHELKTWPEYFAHLVSGRKTFEYRRNDRGFREGDTLHLREYDSLTGRYTGREMHRVVTYALPTDASGDFVVMALAPLEAQQAAQDATITRLRKLPGEWRAECARINGFHATMGSGWAACADQLEAALAAAPRPTPEGQDA